MALVFGSSPNACTTQTPRERDCSECDQEGLHAVVGHRGAHVGVTRVSVSQSRDESRNQGEDGNAEEFAHGEVRGDSQKWKDPHYISAATETPIKSTDSG